MKTSSNTLPTSIAPLAAYSLIRVSEAAAAAFLQGQLTCDINQLENASSLAAHCNTKGRVRALYRVFRIGADFYLRCPKSLLDKALSFLQFYARFSKVSLTPIEHVTGFGIIVPTTETQTLPFPALQINGAFHTDDGYTVLRVPGTSEWDRYEIYQVLVTSKHLDNLNLIEPWLSSLPALPESQWDLSNILAGIPEIFPETSEQFLPHYIGLPQLGAVSFNKGCYIGQEIVARMEYRSKQQKYRLALTKIALDSPNASLPKPGDTLADQTSVCVLAAPSLVPHQPYAYALIQTLT